MLSLFYVVLVIALTSVGLLFYLLFRRRVSLSILRARGYLGVTLCGGVFALLLVCAAVVGMWNAHDRESPSHVSDLQYEQLSDWFGEYEDHTFRLERAYQQTIRFADSLGPQRVSYRAAMDELDDLTDNALLLKSSFTVHTAPPELPATLAHRINKLTTDDKKAYEAHIRLLLSIRRELLSGADKTPLRRVSRDDVKQIRLLVLAEIPAHNDTNVRLYKLRRDIDETFRHERD